MTKREMRRSVTIAAFQEGKMPTQLQLYRAPEDLDDLPLPEPTVHIRLGDLMPLIAMAQKLNFIWLKDFLDDEVAISDDLHELLLSLRPGHPNAG
jgi:hypothetical protein